MKLNRTYNTLKLNRSYIGGSEKSENDLFIKVQGDYEDACDWLEYRRMFIIYYNDRIHVDFSWKYILNKARFIFLFSSILFIINPIFIFISIGLFLLLSAFKLYFRKREFSGISGFTLSIYIINKEIKNRYNIDLTANE
jgi:hypothetical protein